MISPQDFHVFAQADQHYLFLTQPVAVFKVDADTAGVLARVEKGETPSDPAGEARWQEAAAFMARYQEKAPPARVLRGASDITEKVRGLYLFVSQECNLKCTYCYGHEGEYGQKGRMSEATMAKTFDTFFGNETGRHFVTFFGGEPLMNFPLMKKSVELGKQFREAGKAQLSFGIVTNGTFHSEEIGEFFNQHIDRATFSLDGPADLNDRQRLSKRGDSVYRAVTGNVRKLTAGKRFNWAFRAIVGRPGHGRLTEIYEDLAKFQPGGIGIVNADVPAGDPLALSEAEYRHFVDQIIEINRKGLRTFIDGEQPVAFEYPFYILFHFITRSHALYHCNAGANLLAVTAEGDVYPCHRFVGEEAFKLGNVADPQLRQSPRFQEIRAAFAQATVDQREGCRECWARYLCGGSCARHAYAEHGDIAPPVARHCYYIKTVIEAILPDIVALVSEPETHRVLMTRLKAAISQRHDHRVMDAAHVS